MRKRAEEMLRSVIKRYHWYWHKYGDVRYCPHCHGTLPKSENAPDFAVGMVYTYVEAKNSGADDIWHWPEISETGTRKGQREWLREHAGWLFIELGSGKAPKGKSAYLVPFDQWVGMAEVTLIKAGQQSLRRKPTTRCKIGADELLAEYSLVWQGGWTIPSNHVWWRVLSAKLQLELDAVEKMINER